MPIESRNFSYTISQPATNPRQKVYLAAPPLFRPGKMKRRRRSVRQMHKRKRKCAPHDAAAIYNFRAFFSNARDGGFAAGNTIRDIKGLLGPANPPSRPSRTALVIQAHGRTPRSTLHRYSINPPKATNTGSLLTRCHLLLSPPAPSPPPSQTQPQPQPPNPNASNQRGNIRRPIHWIRPRGSKGRERETELPSNRRRLRQSTFRFRDP
jgi:hypothetical protein